MNEGSGRAPRELWEELRRKYVDEWSPTEDDVRWLKETVRRMKIGGVWIIPAVGAVFEKVAEDHIRLKSITTDDIINAIITIERTKKVGDLAGIKVDIEKAADYIVVRL